MYFEVCGNGLIYSANFERQFPKSYGSFGFRVGTGYTEIIDSKIFALPLGINFVLGKTNRGFETGFGLSYIYNTTDTEYRYTYNDTNEYIASTSYATSKEGNISVVLNFGYRSEPKNGSGVSFRAGFSPTYYNGDFVPYYPYLSIGYKFN